MWKFLTRIFRKPTKNCESCGKTINMKRDAAMCLHGEEHGIPFEHYICEPCAEAAWLDAMNDFMLEEITVAEEN